MILSVTCESYYSNEFQSKFNSLTHQQSERTHCTCVYGSTSERKWVAKVSVMVSQLIEWQPHKWIHIHTFNDCLLLSLHLSSRSFSQSNKNILNFIKTFSLYVCACVCECAHFYIHFAHFYYGFFCSFISGFSFCCWLRYENATELYCCVYMYILFDVFVYVCSFLIQATHTKIRECYLNDILLWLFSFLFLTFSSWHQFHSHTHRERERTMLLWCVCVRFHSWGIIFLVGLCIAS